MEIGILHGGESLSAKFSGKRKRPPATIFALIDRPVNALVPCAEVILTAAARRVIVTGGDGGADRFLSATASQVKTWRRRRSAARQLV